MLSLETSSEQPLQPVMTQTLFDQTLLQWQNLQDWAQKTWTHRNPPLENPEDETKPNRDTSTLETNITKMEEGEVISNEIIQKEAQANQNEAENEVKVPSDNNKVNQDDFVQTGNMQNKLETVRRRREESMKRETEVDFRPVPPRHIKTSA